nr:hypothetical protein [Tanacetum cinerariifolium]
MSPQSSLLPQVKELVLNQGLDDKENEEKEEDADDETKSDEDDIYKYKIRVYKEEDEEMINAEVDDSDKGDEDITNAAKADAEKRSEIKDDPKKTKLPLSRSSLFVSSGISFNSYYNNTTSSICLHHTICTSTNNNTNSHTTNITTAILKSNALTTVGLRVAKLEKDVSDLKKIDLSAKTLAALKTQVPSVVDNYLGSKAALEEYDLKSTPYQSMHANKSFNRNLANHQLYHALMEALIEDENRMDKGVADTVKDHKRKHGDDNDDDDEDPPAGPNQGSKTGKSASAKEPVKEPIAEVVMDDVGDDVARDDNQPQDTSTSNPNITYTTSIKKTKAAQYEIKEIEYMVPTLWSTIKHAYNKDDEKGIKYWGERRKLWYRSHVSKFSKHNVYSTKEILEEIVLNRSDQQLYKFKEGDFVDLHLNDIEDMLILVVQHKLFHLDGSDVFYFIVALRMFTRRLILNRRIEDLQLGVDSYQKKLNTTKPQKTFPEIKFKEPYTPSYDPPRIIYEDLNKQKRVLRADELYKFSDDTLKSVHDEIHHRVLNFHLDYNKEMPTRKWMAVDRRRSGLMIELIDKQLREKGNHHKSRAIVWCKGTRDGLKTDDAYCLIVWSNLKISSCEYCKYIV